MTKQQLFSMRWRLAMQNYLDAIDAGETPTGANIQDHAASLVAEFFAEYHPRRLRWALSRIDHCLGYSVDWSQYDKILAETC